MNIRLLKKLRKRYEWKWQPDYGTHGLWEVIDHKRKTATNYFNTTSFVAAVINDNVGFWNYTKFISRSIERANQKKYYSSVKKK